MEEDNTVVRYLLEQLPEYHKRLEDELKIYYHFIEDVINKLKNIEFVLNVQPININIKPLQDEISRINHEKLSKIQKKK
ncbi:hypothetical protein J2S00_000156 [Caldalkalibacillus uzonensis]|uniref:Uncharacterized protein n=1 Tax=Caldalkalibacillus uzonensis TaxID=353224 RepID=A0ABU0CLU2_9BACI|nr:hypothetical protein [Caldalkalibacillus uzonensis]MDQ0337386.1 hypothetical protein [Caldalkalibacillus uzonensis]